MIATAIRPPVLVIDDEIGTRESLRYLLKDSYDVTCADCVDMGLQRASEKQPDLILLDIRMPGKNGLQGLRELRARDPLTSVVMLTGFGALETAQEALRLGASDYINKPFDTKDMLDVVDRFTRRSQMEHKRARMLKELKDMNCRLVEDLAAKDRLALIGKSSVEFAHDLRNPLTVVIGYADLLHRQLQETRSMLGGEFEQAAEFLGVIEMNLKRCHDLVQLWQDSDQAEAARHQPLAVSALLDDLVQSLGPLVSAINVDMEYRLEPGDARIAGSRPQLVRAVHNVIANAIDAVTPGGGKIVLACSRAGDCVELVVSDNGCGMDQETLDHAFEPYFTTKPKGKGTGLGTVIARRIVEEHGGMIEMRSRVGEGTTVRIVLPALPLSDQPQPTSPIA